MRLLKAALFAFIALSLSCVSYAAMVWVTYAATALLTGSVKIATGVSVICAGVYAVLMLIVTSCIIVGGDAEERAHDEETRE